MNTNKEKTPKKHESRSTELENEKSKKKNSIIRSEARKKKKAY